MARNTERDILNQLLESSEPLTSILDADPILDRSSEARLVLIGEASHGTSDFYHWRAEITKRLIIEQQISFVAVEGDWPECFAINQFVKGYGGNDAKEVLSKFRRWPTWMWANEEILEFIQWLKDYNDSFPEEPKVGFYGMDVYSLWQSLEAVKRYLREVDPAALAELEKTVRCFEPFGLNTDQYALATAFTGVSCEPELISLLSKIRHDQHRANIEPETETAFGAEQNALVAAHAEEYYRTMLRGNISSWNLRDHHMAETIGRLLNFYGSKSRGIIWAHNNHVIDAGAAEMGKQGTETVGEIVRDIYGEDQTVLIGFGTNSGEFIAAKAWDEKPEKMIVPPARTDSWENLYHQLDGQNRYLIHNILGEKDAFFEPRLHRGYGVVHEPTDEISGYQSVIMPLCYDVFIYLDQTTALHPLDIKPSDEGEPPETYPSSI